MRLFSLWDGARLFSNNTPGMANSCLYLYLPPSVSTSWISKETRRVRVDVEGKM